MHRRRLALAILAGLALLLPAGCSDAGRDGGFPALLPLAPLLTDPPSRIAPDSAAALAARAAGLRTRAGALRAPVLAPADKRRLTAAMAGTPRG